MFQGVSKRYNRASQAIDKENSVAFPGVSGGFIGDFGGFTGSLVSVSRYFRAFHEFSESF